MQHAMVRRRYKASTPVMARRTMRIIVAWRAAIVRARLDEEYLNAGAYVQKTKDIARRLDLWNEFEYLPVNKNVYVSDLLAQVVKEAVEYIRKGPEQ